MKIKNPPFVGAATALITSFTPAGEVDTAALERLIDRQVSAGISALIILGTTGEPSTLSEAESAAIVERARRAIAGRAKLVVGVGGNNTAHCISNAKRMHSIGADALLAVTPYYNKTSPSGLIAHFTALADATELPLIVYNVPARTGLNLTPDVMNTLADHPRIAGLKEASSNIEQIVELFAKVHGRVAIYSGSDDQNFIYMALGGEGVISVLSNLMPDGVVKLCKQCADGDYVSARQTSNALHPISKALFWETSPIPLKAAMAYKGLCGEDMRLPLAPLREDLRGKLFRVVDDVSAISVGGKTWR